MRKQCALPKEMLKNQNKVKHNSFKVIQQL